MKLTLWLVAGGAIVYVITGLLVIRYETATVLATDPPFDVPALLDQDISQIEQSLGPPAREDVGDKEASTFAYKHFHAGEYALSVTYTITTGIVERIWCGPNPRKAFSKRELLHICNLDEVSGRYTVSFSNVKNLATGKNAKRYAGVLIDPTK